MNYLKGVNGHLSSVPNAQCVSEFYLLFFPIFSTLTFSHFKNGHDAIGLLDAR